MEIRIEHVSKAYGGKTVLNDVSFIAESGITRVAGPSGAGKTTLMRILLGLESTDSGRVVIPERFRWAAVFQEDRLLENKTALGNIRFALGSDYDEGAATKMLDELGLSDVGDKKVKDYSGGMKRRLALARALLAKSDGIVLDEPFTGLDEKNRDIALGCVINAAKNKTVLICCHESLDIPANLTVTLKIEG